MVRLGVVGTGIWGSMHVKAYLQHPEVELVGICDRDERRLASLGDEYRIENRFTDVEDLLSLGLDGVSVVTPDDTHTSIVIKAFESGAHVLVEKPLAKTVDECEIMIAASEKSERILMVDWHNRWNPPFCGAKTAAESGELGDIRYIYYRLSDTVYVPVDMLPWASRSSVLWFLGSHSFDTACWIMGKRPVSVYCRRSEGLLRGLGVDTPDYYVSLIGFEDGTTAVIENAWILPRQSPSLIDHKCEILGSKGAVYLDPTHHRAFAKYSESTAGGYPNDQFADMLITPVIHGRQMGFAVESIYHFVECVRDRKSPLADGYDGLLNTRLLLAAEESARTGVTVEIV